MKALILAAGLGSRLKHKTSEIPKALVEVNGKPILSYQLNSILMNGIKEVIIVLGYNGNKIIKYIDTHYSELSVDYVWNNEFNESNSSYSFWLAANKIEDDAYLHFNCDIIASSGLVKKLITSKYDNVIAINRKAKLSNNMELVAIQKNKIIKMQNIFFPKAIAKAFGVAKFSSQSTQTLYKMVNQYINAGDKNQNYYGLIRQAVLMQDYFVEDANEELLLEINTLNDLTIAENRLTLHENI